MSKMNILFIGSIYSDNQKEFFLKNSKKGYQFASQNLQESLIEGFIDNFIDITVLTKASLSTFPQGFKTPYVKGGDYVFKGHKLGKCVSFVNLPFFNRGSRKCYNQFIENWYNSHVGPKWIFLYALHSFNMQMCVDAKNKFPDLKISVIVPDLPKYMGVNKWYKMLGLQERDIRCIYRLIKEFDVYVPLALPMMKDLGVEDKPNIVMEGIFSPEKSSHVDKLAKKTILYTGKATPRYGLSKLVEAFKKIEGEDYQLLIRGNGMSDELISLISTDNRIKNIPAMPKEELLKLEQSSTLLVNPVPYSEEFTKYFFPSKTMDYLASGTPTLMYELDCLPLEYKEHLVLLKDESIEALRDKIVEVCNWSSDYSREKGEKAREFILTQKNAKCQVRKIIDLLESFK